MKRFCLKITKYSTRFSTYSTRSYGAIEVVVSFKLQWSFKSFIFYFLSNVDSTGIEVKFIDMQTIDSKIVILASAFNFSHTPQVFYALITIVEENQSFAITNYCQMKHNTFYTGNPVNDVIRMKFTMTRNAAYIYEDKTIFQVYLNGEFISPSCRHLLKIFRISFFRFRLER